MVVDGGEGMMTCDSRPNDVRCAVNCRIAGQTFRIATGTRRGDFGFWGFGVLFLLCPCVLGVDYGRLSWSFKERVSTSVQLSFLVAVDPYVNI